MTRDPQTAVIFIVFNRPQPTAKVFEAIRAAQPGQLLVIADGPRKSKVGERERCIEVRRIATAVDWDCVVLTNFSEENLGCHPRIVSGLDWAFSLVEDAIILEDDCYPDASFFPFCEEMLERFRDDMRVAAIGGTNFLQDHVATSDSYFFSLLTSIWGWATWRSRWQSYDRDMKSWPIIRETGALSELFDAPSGILRWTKIFDETLAAGGRGAWDYRWVYSTLLFNRLTIVPRVNLIRNLGFGEDATHTFQVDSRRKPKLNQLTFPLQHPAAMVNARSMQQRYESLFKTSLVRRASRRLRKLLDSSPALSR